MTSFYLPHRGLYVLYFFLLPLKILLLQMHPSVCPAVSHRSHWEFFHEFHELNVGNIKFYFLSHTPGSPSVPWGNYDLEMQDV
jgi:hypothetical protein